MATADRPSGTLPAWLLTERGRLPLAAVATDLDRTLTDPDLKPVEEALSELSRLRSHGVRVVLCTGRAQAELPAGLPRGLFDGLVLEGGAMAGLPDRLEPLRAPDGWFAAAEAWLQARRIAYIQGQSYLSILATHVRDAEALARDVPVTYHLNNDRVDLTPPGVDKGAGLRRVLGLLGVEGPVLAFGDNHNDIPLLQAATHRVAVGNAVEALKAIAHHVPPHYGGNGVAAFLRERVVTGAAPIAGPPLASAPPRAPA
jgi:hydroxymethylpyrimidine pyrophosphatase-like HAD family hydrolase